MFSKEVYGEIREQNPVRERFVAYKMVEKWLGEGHSAGDIARIWNQGHPGKCSAGVNKWGVAYDSCAYARKVLTML
jgi:hypothetical protein